MNLSELKAKGALVNGAPVPRTIEWTTPEGEEVNFTVGVKRQSFADTQRRQASGEPVTIQSTIADCIFLGDDFSERLSLDDVESLDTRLAGAFMAAINQVNGFGRKEAKNSQPPTSSGTSLSSTESAAEQ